MYFVDQLITGLAIGAVYGLVALSVSLIFAGLDIVHFAQGDILTFGAFFGLMFFDKLTTPFALALLLGILVTAIFGAVIERFIYRPVLKSGGGLTVQGLSFIVLGFGVSVFLQNLAWIIWDPTPKPFRASFGEPVMLGKMPIHGIYLWILGIATILMLLMHLFLKKTKLGQAMRATAYNKQVASLMGINVSLTMSFTFALACGLTAAAGILIAPIVFVQYNMGVILLSKGFAAAVIGGFGNIPGAVVGGLLLGVVENLGAGFISSAYKDVIAFVVMIMVLMVRPTGLFGFITKTKA